MALLSQAVGDFSPALFVFLPVQTDQKEDRGQEESDGKPTTTT